MNMKDPRHDVPIWNSGCAALMCIIFTALLAEAFIGQAGAGPGVHLACALLFLAQAAAIYLSIRPYRSGTAPMTGFGGGGRLGKGADLAAALCLAALGYGGIAWLSAGWALPAGLLALLLCVLPWSRVPLCRNRLPVAAAVLLAGATAALLAAKPVHAPLFLLVPVWMLWLAATGAWLRLILLKRRKSRVLAGYRATA